MLLPNRKFRTYDEETTGWSLGIQKQPWHRGSLCTDHCKSINQSIHQSILLGQDFDTVSGRINFDPTLLSVPDKVKLRLHTGQKLPSVAATDGFNQ